LADAASELEVVDTSISRSGVGGAQRNWIAWCKVMWAVAFLLLFLVVPAVDFGFMGFKMCSTNLEPI